LHVNFLGQVNLKENTEGKAACWKKFRLVETDDKKILFGWAVCADCHTCIMFKSRTSDGSIKLYGTTNMTDHAKNCHSGTGKSEKQMLMNSFVKRKPGVKLLEAERVSTKEAEVRLVVEGGVSFAFVDNPGLRNFAQQMITIGAKHGNIDVEDVLYGRHTVRQSVFNKMHECQEVIKKNVQSSARQNAVSFCTDITTDDVNKNSYSDFTVFWIKDWHLKHAMYRCELMAERHTGENIQKFIDRNLQELGLDLTDTPCTTDKGSNVVAATASKTHVDCACHRLNTVIDTAWKNVLSLNKEISDLDKFCHDIVSYANKTSGLQSCLPTTLKHGGETRPWRSLSGMFSSISASQDALVRELKPRKKEHLIARIDIDLLHEVVTFLSIFPSLFDILEYANVATLQNVLPVYYTLYRAWQPDFDDTDKLSELKRQFLTVLDNKYWTSITMLHFAATFLDPSLKHFRFVTNLDDRDGFFRQVRHCWFTGRDL